MRGPRLILRKPVVLSIVMGATLLIASFSLILTRVQTADAANAKDFNPGRIIDDAVFYNSGAMSASQIQSFLNSKVPSCDTNGTGKATEWGRPDLTRAQYAAMRGWHAPPYTCLKNYKQNTPQMEAASGLCGSIPAYSNRTAAQIINDVSKACGINPQVFLVLLQKEQSLVTDTWPLKTQYSKATGFGCPDTAPCDSSYASFFYQVYYAARQFRVYRAYPTNYNYIAGRTNKIYWQTNLGEFINPTGNTNDPSRDGRSACGYQNVYIQNQATAALYIYTPYQPNRSAMNNLYGTGDSCSAYGNRNFWRMFTDWFGSTTGGDPLSYGINIISPITITSNSDSASTISFKVKNLANTRVSFDQTVVQCRNYQNESCDSNYGGAWYLDPQQERTFSYTISISAANTYRLVPYLSMGNIWYRYDTPTDTSNSLTLQKHDIKIVSPITLNPAYLPPRSSSWVSFQLKNTGNSPIYIERTVVQCRYENNNCDSNYGGPITLGINETQTFGYTFTSMGGGNHTLTPYFMVDGQWYTYNQSGSNVSSRVVDVADLELSSSGIVLSNPSPIPGETITASFTGLNQGISPLTTTRLILQCRLNTVINCDPNHISNDLIGASAQKSYDFSIKIPKAGTYTFIPYFEHMNTWNIYGQGAASATTRTITVAKYLADMRLVGDISLSPMQPKPGDTLTVTYKVKNFGDKSAYYQRSILQCRFNIVTNCDPSYNTPDIIIAPGEERTFINTFTNIKLGTYTFTPYFEQNDEWRLYANGTASTNTRTLHTSPLTITGDLSPASTVVSRGSRITYTYSARNISSDPLTFDTSVLQCRWVQKNTNCDSEYSGVVTLQPGDSRQFTATITFRETGKYRLIPYYRVNGVWYTFSKGVSDYVKEINAH